MPCLCSLTRVGVMVLVCHEANDIFMEAAKMLRYAGSNKMDSMLVGGWRCA